MFCSCLNVTMVEMKFRFWFYIFHRIHNGIWGYVTIESDDHFIFGRSYKIFLKSLEHMPWILNMLRRLKLIILWHSWLVMSIKLSTMHTAFSTTDPDHAQMGVGTKITGSIPAWCAWRLHCPFHATLFFFFGGGPIFTLKPRLKWDGLIFTCLVFTFNW